MGLMTRKGKNKDYFEMFRQSAAIALRAAVALEKGVNSDGIDIEELMAIKGIEHEGDQHVHRSLEEIEAAFITPFDNDQMMDVLRGIEAVTDAIDEIASSFYMMHLEKADKYLGKFISLLKESLENLHKLTEGLGEYKKNSKVLHELIIEINHLEEVGDQTYVTAIHELFAAPTASPIEIMKYTRVYEYMEAALDSCEDVADLIERILISNV